MRIGQLLATAAMFAGAATGAAAPAWADDFSGTYQVSSTDGSTGTDTITSCGPGCAHILSASGEINTDAHLVNGQWVWKADIPDGIACDDGAVVAATKTYTVDAGTLQGNIHTISDGPACGNSTKYSPPDDGITYTKVD